MVVPNLWADSHALLTRLPLVRLAPEGSFDLHVLGLPPAFVLSQDQTFCIYNVKQLPEGPSRAKKNRANRQVGQETVIGLERISIDSTQMPMEQEKPA